MICGLSTRDRAECYVFTTPSRLQHINFIFPILFSENTFAFAFGNAHQPKHNESYMFNGELVCLAIPNAGRQRFTTGPPRLSVLCFCPIFLFAICLIKNDSESVNKSLTNGTGNFQCQYRSRPDGRFSVQGFICACVTALYGQ